MNTYTLDEALLNRSENKFSIWHKEVNNKKDISSASSRILENYLPLDINTSFNFKIEDSIFTMGSCFARRLENTLYKRGSNVPIVKGMIENKDIFENSTSFNKYNTYSMLYELEWALGKKKYNTEDSLIEVENDKFMDLQLVPGDFNPNTFEKVLSRKEKVFSLTREIINAKVITLTLGLIEVWFDKETQRYLNVTPDIKFAKRNKDRFELRILSVDENIDNLNKIYELIKEYNSNFNMIVTVSPVPLLTTFGKNDIIIMNTLSKSTLVCTAHLFSQQYDNVDYFPSYEIATLSKKKLMWENDIRHISADGAEFIIKTFLDNYLLV
jgi:hypothetical protein